MQFKPLSTIAITEGLLKRFFLRIKHASPNECWEWQLAPNHAGYGLIYIGKVQFMAHRVAYYIHHREDPAQLLVCHTCDNRLCCNPAHLFLGDYADNNHDCRDKGRNAVGDKHRSRTRPDTVKKGQAHHMAKMSDETVMSIRRKYATGQFSQSQLAREFGVSQPTIGLVVQGKIWTHLPILPYPRRTGRGKAGSESHWAKLSDGQVEQIKKLGAKGAKAKDLAIKFGVSPGHIRDLIAGRRRSQ